MNILLTVILCVLSLVVGWFIAVIMGLKAFHRGLTMFADGVYGLFNGVSSVLPGIFKRSAPTDIQGYAIIEHNQLPNELLTKNTLSDLFDLDEDEIREHVSKKDILEYYVCGKYFYMVTTDFVKAFC